MATVMLVVGLLAPTVHADPPPQTSGPQDGASLPPAASFLERARARLASNERLLARYHYIEHSVERGAAFFGRGAPGDRVFEVFPHPVRRLTYRRLVRENGAAVPAARQRAQDRAYLETLERYRRELGRQGVSERQAQRQRDAEQRTREREQVDELTRLFDFRLVGREVVDGLPAIVVTFAPRPGIRPSSRLTRAAAAFRGQAWLHEFEHEIIRMDSVAVEDVVFGWGLIARLHAGVRVSVVRQRLADGTWVPSRVRFTGTGRALLFRRIDIDDLREYSAFEPFDAARLTDYLANAGRP